MHTLIEFIKELVVPHKNTEAEEGYEYYDISGKREQSDEWNDFLKYDKFPTLIKLYYTFTCLHIIVLMIRYFLALNNMNSKYLPSGPLYIFFWMIIPPFIWIWSTAYEYWNFHNHKLAGIYIVYTNILVVTASYITKAIFKPVVTLLLNIPINKEISERMVINLAQFILVFLSWLPVIIIWVKIHHLILQPDIKENIVRFKILQKLDLRKNKQFAYDITCIKRMDNGKVHVVKEKDRTLHTAVAGATGTAKTSSVLEPCIADDLDQKRFNENFQKKQCIKLLSKNMIRIKEPFDDKEFSITYFEPVVGKDEETNKQNFEKLEFLRLVSQSAGITVAAPTESFADEIYELAVNRGFQVNRIDPILTSGNEHKPGFIGYNPLYVSPSIKGIKRDITITDNANIFSSVMKALYDMSGSTDAYFVSVNNSITIAIAKLLMLTFEDVHHRQPHPGDLQNCINSFELTRPYLDVLTRKYGKKGKPLQTDTSNPDNYKDALDNSSLQDIDCGIWQDVYTLIKKDLLDPEMAPKMYDRANGLRLQINEFMNHPLIRDVLCQQKSLDIDKALANGEITIVNYSLKLGQNVSTAFGLFFLLAYGKAVVRRPGNENNRILNFCNIDEFPVLLHPQLEEFFSLHRQFKSANIVALQSYDQMEKANTTKFLKSILQGLGHQILFGRVSASEMKLYEQLGGTISKEDVQESVTESSITSEKPLYNYSKRRSSKDVNYVSATDLRYRDFQEITFFTTNDNTPLRPIHGKVNFLRNSKKKGKPPIKVDWEVYYDEKLKNEIYQNSLTLNGEMSTAKEYNKNFFTTSGKIQIKKEDDNISYHFLASGQTSLYNDNVAIKNEPLVETDSASQEPTESMHFTISGKVKTKSK